MNTSIPNPKPSKTLGQRIKFYSILTLVAGLVLFTLITLYATMGSYSDGFRVGNVIKLSNKGFIFKTYEGQLDQGYITQGADGINTRIWSFSVGHGDEQVRTEIDKAITTGRKVKLFYKEKFIRVFFMGDTKYFVYKVEEVR